MLSFISPGAHGCSSRGHSLTRERICAGKWKRKESLDASGELVLHPSTEIQAAAAPLVWAVPAHLYLLEAMHQSHHILHINRGEPQLCPEAAQTRAPSPVLRFQDASSASQPLQPAQAQQHPVFRLTCRAPPAAQPWSPSPGPPLRPPVLSLQELTAFLALSLSPLLTHPLLTMLGTCLIFDVSLLQAVFYLDAAVGEQ